MVYSDFIEYVIPVTITLGEPLVSSAVAVPVLHTHGVHEQLFF